MSVLLREAVPEDARAAARLLADTFPHLPVTARRVRRKLVEPSAAEQARHVAAMDGSRLIGWARSQLDPDAPSGHGHVLVAVHPQWRRQGIGSALLADAEWHLSRNGVTTLHAGAIEDPATGAFCANRGWHPSRWRRFLSLDLAGLEPAPIVKPQVHVHPAWLLEDRWPLFMAYTECLADEPREVPLHELTYERWLDQVWHSPDHDPMAGMVALIDGRVASYALFNADRPSGRIWSISTGTRREWRGQGLARLVKSIALHRAAERGLRTAWTPSDPDNPAIAAVNDALGYRLAVTQVVLVRHLP